MNMQVENLPETNNTTFENVTNMAHKMVQLGLGVVVVTQENLNDLFNEFTNYTDKLVERGEKVEKNSRKRVNKLVEKRRAQVKKITGRVETAVNEQSETVLDLVNVPSATDIENLNKKVASLGRKLDKIRHDQEEAKASAIKATPKVKKEAVTAEA